MRIPDFTVSQFGGLNTFVKDLRTLKPGIAVSSKNWLTAKYGDHIELRRGQALLGQTRLTGAGKVTGLGVGVGYGGKEVAFFSHGQKVRYYNDTDDDTHEVGTNLLGSKADGEDVWFSGYQNLAGPFMYLGSPNSGIYKIPLGSPGTAVDQAVNNFRFGVLRFGQGRAFAGRRNGTLAGNKDDTGHYLSAIDKALLSSFTQTTGESFGTGDGSTRTFTHTLTALLAKETAMYLSVTDGVETFTDDRNGVLIGSLGGTGTINYVTGVASVTFATAPLNLAALTCSYYVEDATNGGVLDFDTGTLGAGKAKIFRQDDGGPFMASIPFLDVEYAFHLLKTWAVTTTIDDTAATNLPYRNIGIRYPRAAHPTPEGILVIDTSNPSEPKVRRMEIGQNSTNLTIVPTPISDALDLSLHGFDYGVAFKWGELEIVCVQEATNAELNAYNSAMYVRNTYSGAWDKLDFAASCLAILDGTLIAGDPVSNNVFTLFSGYDDDGSPIDNFWQDGQLNLGTERLKRAHYMRVTGLTQKDQNIDVSLVPDDGSPVTVFTIEGTGSYVDSGTNTSIGSYTLGSKVVGGGGDENAHPFDVTFPIHTDVFQHISTRFQATGIGYAEIDSYEYKDIRDKGSRSLSTKISQAITSAVATIWSASNYPWRDDDPWTGP